MNAHQRYLLGLLKEIHDICQANGITYYIAMGTLIGAVRNGGFLPWDDDADILMTYDELQKFKKVCETDLPANRFLGTADTQESYGHLLPRYVSRDTTSIHTCQSLHDDVAGEMIDIFVLDPIADGDEAYDAYIQDLYLYSAVVNYANAAGTRFEIDPERFKRYMNDVHERGKLEVARKLEANLASHFDEQGSRYAFRWQGVPICFERSWFDEVVPIAFEDTVLMAPAGINEFLTCYYGEEWPDIPGFITPTKHNTAASLDFPYTEALEYYRPTFDRSELLAQTEERRYICFCNAPEENALKDATVSAKSALIAMDTTAIVAQRRREFDEALEQADAPVLAEMLKGYLDWQTNGDMIGRHADKLMYRYAHPMLVDVPDDVFEAGLVALMGTNRLRFVSRLLEIRRLKNLPLTPLMDEFARTMESFNRAANDYHHGRYREGLEGAQRLLEQAPVAHVAIILRLACACAGKLFAEDPSDANAQVFRNLVERGREEYPADGTFAKLQADYLEATGLADQATDLYLRAAESTRNGLSLHAIAQKTGYHPSWLRNAPWAADAGIPSWPGETPQQLVPAQGVRSEKGIAHDGAQEYLMQLLCEVTSFFDERGFSYVLSPAAARAIAQDKAYPANADAYALIVEPKGLLAFVESCNDQPKKNRMLDYLGTNARKEDFTVRYCARGTTYVDLKKHMDANSMLGITLVAPELVEYPLGLKVLAGYWHGKNFPTKLKGKVLRRYAWLRGVRKSRAGAGDNLFRQAMLAFGGAGQKQVRLDGKVVPFKQDYLDDRGKASLDGHELSVPSDTKSYFKLCKKGQGGAQLKVPASCLCSTTVAVGDLLDAGALDPELPARFAKLRHKTVRSRKILERFRANYAQIKLAVQLKQVSLDLLPQKAHIADLVSRGDVAGLKDVLRSYLKLAKEFETVGDIRFDDEIYEALQLARGNR